VQRRAFLAGIGALTLAARRPEATSGHQRETSDHDITVTVDLRRKLGFIARNFLGLGYEISSVAVPDLLAARDRTYVQFVRTLSTRGVIRVGGNTSDYASFGPNKQAVSAPKDTVLNETVLQQLGSFLQATNWQLIWGLNLGSANEAGAVAEAVAVMAAAKLTCLPLK
jgi:hypothetical protein